MNGQSLFPLPPDSPFATNYQYRNKVNGTLGGPFSKVNFGAMDPFPSPVDEEEEKPDFRKIMSSLYDTEGPASKQYEEYLGKMPQLEQPSWGRRIFAGVTGGLAGFSQGAEAGMTAADEILTQPYRAAMTNWQAKEPGMRYAVTSEQARANTARQIYQAMLEAEDRDFQNQLRLDALAQTGRRNTIIDQHNKNMEQIAREAATALASYRKGQLDLGEKNLGVRKGLLNVAKGRAETYKNAVGAMNRPQRVLPGQNAQAEILAARRVLRDHPEWEDFVQRDENGNVISIKQPAEAGWFSSGTDMNEYKKFKNTVGAMTREIMNTYVTPENDVRIFGFDDEGEEGF